MRNQNEYNIDFNIKSEYDNFIEIQNEDEFEPIYAQKSVKQFDKVREFPKNQKTRSKTKKEINISLIKVLAVVTTASVLVGEQLDIIDTNIFGFDELKEELVTPQETPPEVTFFEAYKNDEGKVECMVNLENFVDDGLTKVKFYLENDVIKTLTIHNQNTVEYITLPYFAYYNVIIEYYNQQIYESMCDIYPNDYVVSSDYYTQDNKTYINYVFEQLENSSKIRLDITVDEYVVKSYKFSSFEKLDDSGTQNTEGETYQVTIKDLEAGTYIAYLYVDYVSIYSSEITIEQGEN